MVTCKSTLHHCDTHSDSTCVSESATENQSTVLSSDPRVVMITLPEDVHANSDLPAIHSKAEPLVIAAPEDLSQKDIVSVTNSVLYKVDDAIVADSAVNISAPAHVGATNNANCADIGFELATVPTIDSDISACVMQGAQQSSERHCASEEVIAKDTMTPSTTSDAAALDISESVISIHELHEEQVGALFEMEQSAGLPADALQAVHEIGQNYWKPIFDVSDDDIFSSKVCLWFRTSSATLTLELERRAAFKLPPAWTRTSLRGLEKSSLCLSPSLRS